jgi:spore coat protein U-like protein
MLLDRQKKELCNKAAQGRKETNVRISKTVAVVGVGAAMAFAGFGAVRTNAATATANLGVSATVTNNCTISTAALAFGSYDPVVANASANLDGTGTVVVACTKGSTATIGLGLGSNASGSVRRMSDGSSNFLTYELYQDSGRSTIWGNSGAGLLSPVAAPSKAARNFTVYGRVTSNQDVPAGSYNDTVVATVNF